MFVLFVVFAKEPDRRLLKASPLGDGLTGLVPFFCIIWPFEKEGELERVPVVELGAAKRENTSFWGLRGRTGGDG